MAAGARTSGCRRRRGGAIRERNKERIKARIASGDHRPGLLAFERWLSAPRLDAESGPRCRRCRDGIMQRQGLCASSIRPTPPDPAVWAISMLLPARQSAWEEPDASAC